MKTCQRGIENAERSEEQWFARLKIVEPADVTEISLIVHDREAAAPRGAGR